jgi:uncharacterized protein
MMAGRASGGGREAIMPAFGEYGGQRAVLLTTRKRDGTTVGTPVHSALGPDGSAYFRTWSATGKAKRMRNSPRVWIAPCTARGKATGPQRQATALLLTGPQAAVAGRALAVKYPVLQGVLVPAFTGSRRRRPSTTSFCPPDVA